MDTVGHRMKAAARRRCWEAALALSAGFAAAGTSHAADLVTNGGFETNSFAGWTQFGDRSFTGTAQLGQAPGSPAEGTFFAFFGPVGLPAGISQSIGLEVGREYVLGFDLANLWDLDNSFSVSLGGDVLVSFRDALRFPYRSFNVLFTANAENEMLTFSFVNNPSYWNLDAVTIVALPEPGIFALFLAGLAVTALAQRRRRADRADATGDRVRPVSTL